MVPLMLSISIFVYLSRLNSIGRREYISIDDDQALQEEVFDVGAFEEVVGVLVDLDDFPVGGDDVAAVLDHPDGHEEVFGGVDVFRQVQVVVETLLVVEDEVLVLVEVLDLFVPEVTLVLVGEVVAELPETVFDAGEAGGQVDQHAAFVSQEDHVEGDDAGVEFAGPFGGLLFFFGRLFHPLPDALGPLLPFSRV